jgi:branched-chain amino acid transport system substrate-binding protein
VPHRWVKYLVVAAAVVVVSAGCSSSGKSASSSTTASSAPSGSAAPSGSTASGGTTGSGGTTYTVGLLTDLTGAGSPTAGTSPLGVKAGIGLAAQEGYKIKYVVADTGTTPAGTLAAAQKLVDEDHVYAVFAISALAFAAANFLASKGVPVIGADYDGPEWLTKPNMFSIYGYDDFTKVNNISDLTAKELGGTVIGTVGTAISPSSSDAAKSNAVAAPTLGLRVGYINPSLPFGTTNVGPIVLAMKSAGVNALLPEIDQATAFVLLEGLQQEGVKLKAAILATGGGGDLFNGGPAAERAAQGVYFNSPWEPVVMHTAATTRFQNALKTYAGVTQEPTQGEYNGYTSVDAFVTGLKAAGSNPTQAEFIKAMLGITSYTDAGLFGSHTIGFAMDQRGNGAGADDCSWITQFSGSDFHTVPGLDPICGSILPGKTVSSS